MNWPEQICGGDEIFQSKFEKQSLAGFSFGELLPDRIIIGVTVFNGVIKNCGVRREASDGEFIPVALERTAIEEISCNIIQPEALADVVELLRRFHSFVAGEGYNSGGLFAIALREPLLAILLIGQLHHLRARIRQHLACHLLHFTEFHTQDELFMTY